MTSVRAPKYLPRNAVEIASQLLSVLNAEQRRATYKQAFSIALVQECSILRPGSSDVSLFALADRVIDLYWGVLDPFVSGETAGSSDDRQELRQLRNDTSGELLKPIRRLKNGSSNPGGWRPGRSRQSAEYLLHRRKVAQELAKMPATHLQGKRRLQPRPPDFLYHSAWLHHRLTIAELKAHDWKLVMLPGVVSCLGATSVLTLPALRALWEADVRRFNPRVAGVDRVGLHLFGADRKALAPVRAPLLEAQLGRCFYCGKPIKGTPHVDHVLPWSRTSLDDLANLVVVDARCNERKSDVLPAPSWVLRSVARDQLVDLAVQIDWVCEPAVVAATALALYGVTPMGSQVWIGGANPDELFAPLTDELMDAGSFSSPGGTGFPTFR